VRSSVSIALTWLLLGRRLRFGRQMRNDDGDALGEVFELLVVLGESLLDQVRESVEPLVERLQRSLSGHGEV
jgi:hypothetical protein